MNGTVNTPIMFCHSYESIVALLPTAIQLFTDVETKELHHMEGQTAITSHTDLGKDLTCLIVVLHYLYHNTRIDAGHDQSSYRGGMSGLYDGGGRLSRGNKPTSDKVVLPEAQNEKV